MLRVLATTVVVLVGVRLAAPVLNPVFFAVVLALLFSPIYAWLGRRGLPRPVALVVMLVGMTLLSAVGVTVLLFVLGVDFALMWGILTFFLSFVPYVGLVLASAPPVLLAEFGVGRASLVIAGVTVVNTWPRTYSRR